MTARSWRNSLVTNRGEIFPVQSMKLCENVDFYDVEARPHAAAADAVHPLAFQFIYVYCSRSSSCVTQNSSRWLMASDVLHGAARRPTMARTKSSWLSRYVPPCPLDSSEALSREPIASDDARWNETTNRTTSWMEHRERDRTRTVGMDG